MLNYLTILNYLSIFLSIFKYLGAIKYKIPKAVAHAERALQLLTLIVNYAQLLSMEKTSRTDCAPSAWHGKGQHPLA